MTFPISRVKTWTAEILTYADLNAEFDNIIDNLESDNINDSSANAAAMQATVDPYPAASESLATHLEGELHRLRYVIAQITGETYWYVDPDASLLGAFVNNTYGIVYQDTAPTNWTIQNTLDDKLLFISRGSAAGGETGGGEHSSGTWTQPDHTHTGPSHTHSGTSLTAASPASVLAGTGAGSDCGADNHTHSITGNTGADGTGATGGSATANTWRPAAYCAIIIQRA